MFKFCWRAWLLEVIWSSRRPVSDSARRSVLLKHTLSDRFHRQNVSGTSSPVGIPNDTAAVDATRLAPSSSATPTGLDGGRGGEGGGQGGGGGDGGGDGGGGEPGRGGVDGGERGGGTGGSPTSRETGPSKSSRRYR
eukprot:scaffold3501_cov113-Isochrysis_galbana.AAC.3